jgi:hypothetical protein
VFIRPMALCSGSRANNQMLRSAPVDRGIVGVGAHEHLVHELRRRNAAQIVGGPVEVERRGVGNEVERCLTLARGDGLG